MDASFECFFEGKERPVKLRFSVEGAAEDEFEEVKIWVIWAECHSGGGVVLSAS